MREEAFDLAQAFADLGLVVGGEVVEGEGEECFHVCGFVLFTLEESGSSLVFGGKMGFAMGMMDALKCKDAEDVLIQKIEVKRSECVCVCLEPELGSQSCLS